MERNIINNAKRLIKLYEAMCDKLKIEVNFIIDNNITNKNIIERCLDVLLSIPTEKAYLFLKTLCNYYITIDNEAALFYLNMYDELYNEEEIKVRKKDYKHK